MSTSSNHCQPIYQPLSLAEHSDYINDWDPTPLPYKNTSQKSLRNILRLTPAQRTFAIRMLAFSAIELAFFAIASVISMVQLPFPDSISLSEAKGAVTLVSVAWHALAAFMVKDILVHVFSVEWMHLYRRSGIIIPGKTDLVSRLTAGIVDHVQHTFSPAATLSFRLAFITSLLVLALNTLGPSVITVNPITVQVAVDNFTVATVNASNADSNVASRIMQSEMFDGFVYGFRFQPVGSQRYLVPWPDSRLLADGHIYTYESDIIEYGANCSWNEPTAVSATERYFHGWLIGESIWEPDGLAKDPLMSVFGQLDLSRSFGSSTVIAPLVPTTLDSSNLDSVPPATISIIFIGYNSTVNITMDDPLPFPLDGLPTTLIPLADETNKSTAHVIGNVAPMVATALLCDFGPKIHSASITLANGNLSVSSLLPDNHINNVGSPWINKIFTDSFLDSLMLDLTTAYPEGISAVAGAAFVDNDHGKFLSINEINDNLNTLLPSAAKPYLDGMKHSSDSKIRKESTFSGIRTNAKVGLSRNILVDSGPFLFALLAVVIVILMLSTVLIVLVDEEHFQTFDLKHVTKVADKVHFE